MILRPFQPGDIEPLRAILNTIIEAGDAFVYDVPFSAEQMQEWIASYQVTYVVESDGRILGGYVLRPNQPGRGAHVANATYLVSPDARGRGVGRLLGEHSLQTAKDLGFAAIQFNAVVSTNTAAVALWKSLSFQVIGIVPEGFRRRDGKLVDLLIMHHSL